MKRKYIDPELEVIKLEAENDIVTSSDSEINPIPEESSEKNPLV